MQKNEMENDNKLDAMKKRCTEELSLPLFTNIHTNKCHHVLNVRQHLKWQQEENKASVNDKCHPTSPPSLLNEPQ